MPYEQEYLSLRTRQGQFGVIQPTYVKIYW